MRDIWDGSQNVGGFEASALTVEMTSQRDKLSNCLRDREQYLKVLAAKIRLESHTMSVYHNSTVPSSPTLAIVPPLGLKATLRTAPV